MAEAAQQLGRKRLAVAEALQLVLCRACSGHVVPPGVKCVMPPDGPCTQQYSNNMQIRGLSFGIIPGGCVANFVSPSVAAVSKRPTGKRLVLALRVVYLAFHLT